MKTKINFNIDSTEITKQINDVITAEAISKARKIARKQFDDALEHKIETIIKAIDVDIKPQYWQDSELRKTIVETIKRTIDGMYKDNADSLRQLFMMSETSNSKWGQFFTPYDVSKMCAKITLTNDEEKLREKDIIAINDPCCGSGGMLLAGLDVLMNDYGINYTERVFISCGDIDARCAQMCYIQLFLAGVPAIVKKQNALTRELYDVWKTPAYIFQYQRFRRFEGYIQNG